MSRQAGVWPNGKDHRCERCSRRGDLCIMVQTEDIMTILPAFESQGASGVEDEEYWFGDTGIQ